LEDFVQQNEKTHEHSDFEDDESHAHTAVLNLLDQARPSLPAGEFRSKALCPSMSAHMRGSRLQRYATSLE
jgi:hypothetical protein